MYLKRCSNYKLGKYDMPRYLIQAVGVFGFKLHLNNMLGRYCDQLVFGPFETYEEAAAFYNSELVDPYEVEGPDMLYHGRMKTYIAHFRQGGPLEWCHPFHSHYQWHELCPQGAGICEELISVTEIVKESKQLD